MGSTSLVTINGMGCSLSLNSKFSAISLVSHAAEIDGIFSGGGQASRYLAYAQERFEPAIGVYCVIRG